VCTRKILADFPTGSVSFINLVLANATSHTQHVTNNSSEIVTPKNNEFKFTTSELVFTQTLKGKAYSNSEF
jgi:hypothetical protein